MLLPFFLGAQAGVAEPHCPLVCNPPRPASHPPTRHAPTHPDYPPADQPQARPLPVAYVCRAEGKSSHCVLPFALRRDVGTRRGAAPALELRQRTAPPMHWSASGACCPLCPPSPPVCAGVRRCLARAVGTAHALHTLTASMLPGVQQQLAATQHQASLGAAAAGATAARRGLSGLVARDELERLDERTSEMQCVAQ
jgi:hypothetical protein